MLIAQEIRNNYSTIIYDVQPTAGDLSTHKLTIGEGIGSESFTKPKIDKLLTYPQMKEAEEYEGVMSIG